MNTMFTDSQKAYDELKELFPNREFEFVAIPKTNQIFVSFEDSQSLKGLITALKEIYDVCIVGSLLGLLQFEEYNIYIAAEVTNSVTEM